EEVRGASTLAALANIYHRPLPELIRANSGIDAEQTIQDGTLINIPDSGFATWIAGRVSAEALVDGALSESDRLAVLQLLVPVAAPNTSILDTVLARMVLAAFPMDPVLLVQLSNVARAPEIRLPAAYEGRLPA